MTLFHYIDDLGRPFPKAGGRNNFDLFEEIKDQYGVYIFVDGSGNTLYVGEAHAQTLRERIAQNYTEDNDGGTFRSNWCECRDYTFSKFKQALGTWKVAIVSTPKKNANWIKPLEAILIMVLKPKYNKAA